MLYVTSRAQFDNFLSLFCSKNVILKGDFDNINYPAIMTKTHSWVCMDKLAEAYNDLISVDDCFTLHLVSAGDYLTDFYGFVWYRTNHKVKCFVCGCQEKCYFPSIWPTEHMGMFAPMFCDKHIQVIR